MSERIEQIIAIAKEAGNIVFDYYNKDYQVTQKNDDPKVLLTTADLASEKYIVEHLKKEFPDFQILSEEQENETIDWSKEVFLVDPLDGTRHFVEHLDTFSINIGICSDGRPVLGVVYLPVTQELLYGENGEGAWYEKDNVKKKMTVSSEGSLENAKVFAAEEHHGGLQTDILNRLPSLRIAFDGATGYKICKVAKGELDLFMNTSQRTSKWDICAPTVILEEAGGKISNFDGSEIDYTLLGGEIGQNYFVSNGRLHKRLLDFIEPTSKV